MNKIILTLLVIALAVSSCDKQDRENTYISQEERIDSYINSLDDSYRVMRQNGANRVVVTEGNSPDSLCVGDSVYFYYSGYQFSGGRGALFATNDTIVAKENGIFASGDTFKLRYGSDGLINGLHNGMAGVREGETCYIIFSAKYGYGNEIMFNLPKLTPLFFDIQVKKVIKKK